MSAPTQRPGESSAVWRAERIYAALLRLYPTTFRNRFGESMRFAFAAQAREAHARGTLAFALFNLPARRAASVDPVDALRGS